MRASSRWTRLEGGNGRLHCILVGVGEMSLALASAFGFRLFFDCIHPDDERRAVQQQLAVASNPKSLEKRLGKDVINRCVFCYYQPIEGFSCIPAAMLPPFWIPVSRLRCLRVQVWLDFLDDVLLDVA